MKKNLVIILLLSFAFTAKAEGTVDSFLKKGQERQRTDTNYVFKPQEKWLLRTRSDVIFSLLDFRNDHPSSGIDFSMNLNSKPQFRQHFGVGYRGIVLGVGINFPLKNADKEFSLKVYQDPAGGDDPVAYPAPQRRHSAHSDQITDIMERLLI